MKAKEKVIAIALEAADIGLVKKWTSENKLPALSKLIDDGIFRRLISSADLASGSTWPTLHTGSNPAKHGISRSHRHLKSGTYRIEKQYATDVKVEPFWLNLSRSGKRCAIVDVPKTFPSEGFNGIHLVNWGDEHQSHRHSSWPPELAKELVDKFGAHPLSGWYQQAPANEGDCKALVENLVNGAKSRTRIARDLLGREKWDLFIVSFAELHWAGHLLWHLMDSGHPSHDPKLAQKHGDALLKVYQAVDQGVGELILDTPDSVGVIFSNSGMGANYSGRHLVPDILKAMGMRPTGHLKRKWLPGNWSSQAFEMTERVVPIAWVKAVKKVIPEKLWDKWSRKALYQGNDWKHSLAFSLPSDYSGAIRINLKGREPEGKVEQGSHYDKICSEIIDGFEQLINLETGEKAVEKVIKVHDEYRGDHSDQLPDLIICWNDSAPISQISSERIGTIARELVDKRSGGHRSFGFLLTHNVVSGEDSPMLANIMDIAPSITHYLGQKVPEHMEGEILPEFL